MLPKISVIIPCYNLGSYLDACLESIATQTEKNVEYVFVNDGSTDETVAKLKHFVKDKSNCKVINQTNAGVSIARNKALDVCSGEYVYLLDGDDILTLDAIKKMIEDIGNENPDAIISKVESLKEGKVLSPPSKFCIGTYSPESLYKSCTFFDPAPQLLYRRCIIEKYGIRFNSKMYLGEVYDFTLRFFLHAKVIKVVDSVYFRYVYRISSASHKPVYERDLSIVYTISEYERHSGDLKNIDSFRYTNFKILMSFTYNKYLKRRLNDSQVHLAIKKLLENPTVRDCLRTVATSHKIPLRERLLAKYVLCTGVRGYKVLSKVLKVI